MKILDCGCGLGRWTKQLIKRYPDSKVIALDHKRRLPQIGVEFIKGSVEKLPFKDNEFDLIIASRLLPYVDIKKAIPELERVCKSGGLIVYELMQLGYYLQRLSSLKIKRVLNLINFISYIIFKNKIFKKYDNIDSLIFLKYYSDYNIIKKVGLKKWIFFPIYSLVITSEIKNNNIYKKRISNIINLAREIINEET